MKYFNKTIKSFSGGIGALALGLSLSLGGCDKKENYSSAPDIYEGVIWEKIHRPEREWLSKISTNTHKGFHTDFVPVYFLDDEDFIIKVMRKKGDKNSLFYENKKLYVDKEIFDKLEIGDKFIYDPKNAEEYDTYFNRAPTKEELKKCENLNRFKDCELKE